MSVFTALGPRRLLIAILTLTLAGATPGVWPARAAQPSSGFAAAWTPWSSSGTVGTAQLTDSSASPGATCTTDVRFNPPFVDIAVNGPTVWPASIHPSQRVGWRAVLYEELPGGRNVPLRTADSSRITASENQPAVLSGLLFTDLPVGPAYFVVAEINWYDPTFSTGSSIEGTASYRIQFHRSRTRTATATQTQGTGATCIPALPPAASLSARQGAVGTGLGYTIQYFPIGAKVNLRWDKLNLGTVLTDSAGRLNSSFVVPETTLGVHTVRWFTGTWSVTAQYTVEARIKASPSRIARGQTLAISLRGYAAGETVRIRWKRGSSWVEVARVTTSAVGSANLSVIVPAWAPDGPASIRGDGTQGRAQTNGVTVAGGTFRPADATATPTASPTPSPTPTAMATTSVAIATATIPATPEPPTPTLTPELTVDPTSEPAPSPTDAPPEPTVTATATSSPAPEPSPTPVDAAAVPAQTSIV